MLNVIKANVCFCKLLLREPMKVELMFFGFLSLLFMSL